MHNPTFHCSPGDIIVTKIPSGYLIRRALAQSGPGPWWEYIAIVATYSQAHMQARTVADTSGHNAWLHTEDDDYKPLSENAHTDEPPGPGRLP